MKRPARVQQLLLRLPALYPDARCELTFANPLELLVATILSAQCTDKRVNQVTPALFARCRTASDYAAIPRPELEALIRSTNFYRSKAVAIQETARMLVVHHAGEVPADLDALVALRGVGRKTANVVLGCAFGLPLGVVVDTHVSRLSRRLGLTRETDPVKIELRLMKLFPREHWITLSHWLILHGRRCCRARKPDCRACELNDLCPSAERLAGA